MFELAVMHIDYGMSDLLRALIRRLSASFRFLYYARCSSLTHSLHICRLQSDWFSAGCRSKGDTFEAASK